MEVLLKEIGILGPESNTYTAANKSMDEIIFDNILYQNHVAMNEDEKEKTLPSMYWLPKMHKTPIGNRFIIASKFCSTKSLSRNLSTIFKLLYNQIQNYNTKEKYLSNYNMFWVLDNIDPIINKLEKINRKKKAVSVSTFDFSTLYTKIPHDELFSRLGEIVDLCFDGGDKSFIAISQKRKAFWATKKGNRKVCFSKSGLKQAIEYLLDNCFFTVGNINGH